MICSLPDWPGYSWVRRTDWMISRNLRSYVEPSKAQSGSSLARTSCWVMVEAPRGRPEMVSTPAEMIPTGSKPAFCQKPWSSIEVVASIISPGIWS